MTISVEEMNRGQSGNSNNWKIDYLVRATDGDADATAFDLADAVANEAPSQLDDNIGGVLVLADVQLQTFHDTPNGPIAFYSAVYGLPQDVSQLGASSPFGDATFDFNYQAPSVHLDFALATRKYGSEDFFPLTDPPDFDDKIRVRYENGAVVFDGIATPAGNTTHTFGLTVPSSYITSVYQDTVLGLLGSVNTTIFKGAPIGTVRFVQCQSQTSGAKARLSWGFQYSPNRLGVTIAGIPDIDIGGHEIWWPLDKTVLDSTTKYLRSQAAAIYVQQVFEFGELNDLGL